MEYNLDMKYARLISPTKSNSYFIFGARGTGKSTLLKDLYPKSDFFWIDLLLPSEEEQYLMHPELLKEKYLVLEKEKRPKTIIIDEVQKVPKLLDVVHYMIEEYKIRFILTGSSARKLKVQSANLLAGRAFQYIMYPFSAFEIANDFHLNDVISYGLLPKLYELNDAADKNDFLRSYVQKYIKEEVQMEQLVRDIVPFRKFLEVAAASNGDILNYSKIGRTCGVDSKSVSRYFEILVDTFLGVMLDSYHTSVRVRQIASPKFYFFDIGVLRALNHQLTQDVLPSNYAYGKLFETFIIMEFIKLNSYLKKDYRFSYLKTTEGAEIDLIVEQPNGTMWILEIKSSKNIIKDDYAHLVHFASTFPKAKAMVLSCDKSHRLVNEVEIIYFSDGIKKIFEI
jgi:predicted AAA+ superfamily ATPase